MTRLAQLWSYRLPQRWSCVRFPPDKNLYVLQIIADFVTCQCEIYVFKLLRLKILLSHNGSRVFFKKRDLKYDKKICSDWGHTRWRRYHGVGHAVERVGGEGSHRANVALGGSGDHQRGLLLRDFELFSTSDIVQWCKNLLRHWGRILVQSKCLWDSQIIRCRLFHTRFVGGIGGRRIQSIFRFVYWFLHDYSRRELFISWLCITQSDEAS